MHYRDLLLLIVVISAQSIMFAQDFVGASEAERRLLHKLLDEYSNLERPVLQEADVLHVSMGLDFQQIIDVDEKNQMITTSLWIKLYWTDHNLVWIPADYDNITDIRIHSDILWRPDVLLYNSADSEFSKFYKSNVVVTSNGACTFIPPGIFKSTCPISIGDFPFDEQHCKLKFGSWTYSALKLNLTVDPNYNDHPDVNSYVKNGEWDLVGIPAKFNEFRYECCPEPYVDLTFTIHVRRRSLFYFFNLVLPCALISSMTLLGFTLPPDSGEKLTLAVTILLSLTVFLLVIADSMPATSDAIPLIGVYFGLIMLMTSLSVLLTVIVLNFHYRTPNTHPFPGWVRKILLEWLPFLLRVKRQESSLRESERGMEKKLTCCCGVDWILSGNDRSAFGCLPLRCTRAASLLATDEGAVAGDSGREVHDTLAAQYGNGFVQSGQPEFLMSHTQDGGTPGNMMMDHYTPNTLDFSGIPSPIFVNYHQKAAAAARYGQPHNMGCGTFVSNEQQHLCARHLGMHTQQDGVCCNGRHQIANEETDQREKPKTSPILEEMDSSIRALLFEMRFMTDRMRQEDDHDGQCNDWKFVATVLDRLFLWLMVIFTVAFTLGIYLKAPEIRLQ